MSSKGRETVGGTPGKKTILNRPVGFREVNLIYGDEKRPDQITAITVTTVKARETIAEIGPLELIATSLNYQEFIPRH